MTAEPASWPIWGLRQAVATLSQAIAADRVRHAYLFAGPAGVGKTALALAFAQALCCLEPRELGAPCGSCRSCRKIARGVHPDVQTYDIETQTVLATKPGGKNTTLTIETVRMLSSSAALRPVEGRWRVIIVDDAELMQDTAQEALLKTLEEPPPFAIIVLLANDAELLLPTVRSRCQSIELSLVPRATIEAGLVGMGVEPAKASELAFAACGAPGWAVRALAQPKLISERVAAIERALAWVKSSPFERIVTAVKLGDTFSRRRQAVFADLEILLGVWRDALLMSAGLHSAVTFPIASETLCDVVSRWSLASIHSALRSVRQCIADLEANVRPRLAIESMVLQWPTL